MSTKRSCLFNGLLVLGFLSCGLWGCSPSSDGGSDPGGSGGTSTTSSGGSGGTSSAGGSGTGGSSSSGGSMSSGGSSAAGGSSATGGSTGGSTTQASGGRGGSSQGGSGGDGEGGSSKTGGAAAGGAAAGGAATGGKATGGAAAGGAAAGGAAAGGAAAGGAAAGGSAAGGTTGAGGTTAGGSTGNGSPGCDAASPLKSGSFTEKINNVDRQWILDVPSGYDNKKPTRLIFVWHPLGGNASQVANGFNGLKSLSNNTTIFVAPNGVNGSNHEASGNGWWNKDDVDVKFLEAMLKKLNEGLCIDQERIFTTGFSFGGMMSYTMPFVFNVFRATAPCSGKSGVIPYTAKVNDAIPIMAFHGTSDPICTLDLAKDFFNKFLTRNGCGTQTKQVSPSPCVEYEGCTVPTIWCQFSGGHEQWREEPAAIWKFFSQF